MKEANDTARPLVDESVQRISEESRERLCGDMFCFYGSLSNLREAGKFVFSDSGRLSKPPNEREVHLALGHPAKAKEPADWCQARLNPHRQGTNRNILRFTLAKYHAHLGDLKNEQWHFLQVGNSDCIVPE
jgi:hypothetical protein